MIKKKKKQGEGLGNPKGPRFKIKEDEEGGTIMKIALLVKINAETIKGVCTKRKE